MRKVAFILLAVTSLPSFVASAKEGAKVKVPKAIQKELRNEIKSTLMYRHIVDTEMNKDRIKPEIRVEGRMGGGKVLATAKATLTGKSVVHAESNAVRRLPLEASSVRFNVKTGKQFGAPETERSYWLPPRHVTGVGP